MNRLTNAQRFNFIVDVGSIAYLLIPIIIFFGGWYRLYIGLSASILCLYVIYEFASKYFSETNYESLAIPSRNSLLILLSITVILCMLGGIGEFVPDFHNQDYRAPLWKQYIANGQFTGQTEDYIKSNIIFNQLTRNPWPVSVESSTHPDAFLCYYIAYYLPASLVGYMTDIRIVPFVSLIWGGLGIFLSLLWLQRIRNFYSWTFVLLIVLFCVVDPLFREHIGISHLLTHSRINEPESYPLNYYGFITHLYWVPQHLIPAWIGLGLIVHLGKYHKWGLAFGAFVGSLTLLWSTFVAIGLFPFWLYFLVSSRFKGLLHPSLIAAGTTSILLGFYFKSHHPFESYPNLIWQIGAQNALIHYATFVGWKVILFILLCVWAGYREIAYPSYLKPLVLFSAMVLLTIPIYRMGIFNDFAMRASMPALMLFTLFVTSVVHHVLFKSHNRTWKSYLLLVFYGYGAMASVRTLLTPIWPKSGVAYTAGIVNSNFKIEDLDKMVYLKISHQYQGDATSFYFKYLSKKH